MNYVIKILRNLKPTNVINVINEQCIVRQPLEIWKFNRAISCTSKSNLKTSHH